MFKKISLAVLLGLALPSAHAAVLDFSYTRSTDNKVLAGQLSGTIQPDGNTVVVSSVLDFVTLDGVAGPALPFVYSTDFINFGTPNLLPVITFDGLFLDFIACDIANCAGVNAITFNAGNASAANFGTNGAPFYASGGFFGPFGETFSATRWAVSSPAQVPEPATTLLLLAGGSLLLFRSRRKTG